MLWKPAPPALRVSRVRALRQQARARALQHAPLSPAASSPAMGRRGIHAVRKALVSKGAMRRSECQLVAL
jgi:hypothetical protein